MKSITKFKKLITICSIIIFLTVIVAIYFVIEKAQKTAVITVFAAPLSANISINGNQYRNMSNINVKPGEYSLSISKDNYFEPYNETFFINDGETKEIYIELTQIGDMDWYKNHPEDATIIETIESKKLNLESDKMLSQYPLIASLPITVEYYKTDSTYVYFIISYDLTKGQKPIITIKDYSGNNFNEALNRIRLEGHNPDDYEIEYLDESIKIQSTKAPDE